MGPPRAPRSSGQLTATAATCIAAALCAGACNLISGVESYSFTEPAASTGATTGGGATGGGGSGGGGGEGGTSGQPSLCDPADPTLIACYPFDEDAEDASGYENTTETSNIAFGPGNSGTALVLDADSLVDIADADWWDVTDFSIEVWIRPTALPPAMGRSCIFDGDDRFALFLYNAGEVRCLQLSGTTLVTLTGPDAPVNAWTHVACVHDDDKARLYVNGEQVSESTVGPMPVSTSALTIGRDILTGDPFIGRLDELRVYNVVLTDDQICADAGKNACGATP
ncbi:LamG domain-containing protein [Chondromyces apiculatus]|uniref:LamG-like jellyroll fold domain-containing protein n=1 Tax=Chondromyces apiculatus DSM 436 TaxID=1192034 RepID=A0A017STB9_9BACT|nr:LamG domain-containing protein [Chondromyces apiculatus]EYF00243.1 Hypothetical protein CAP_1028 [Chondromyces apiculatus DSM 436]